MDAIFYNGDGSTEIQEIDFQQKKWVNYRFKEAELAPGKMSDMLQDLVYFSTIPFFEYLQTTREDTRKALKDLFLKRLGEFFDEALENDMPIEEVIQAKKARDFYSFMESLYSSWLKDSDLQTDMLIHELRDYTFVGLQPAFEEYYTLQAVFENKTGDQRQFPLSLIYFYDNASNYLLGRTATLSLYIATVMLDKLGYSPNPLTPKIRDVEAFEKEQLLIAKNTITEIRRTSKMCVLILNVTSSSIRFALFESEVLRARGTCLQIGFEANGSISYRVPDAPEKNFRAFMELKSHETTLDIILKLLTDKERGVIRSFVDIKAVGHYVKNGGEKLRSAALITDEVKTAIRDSFDLAPLHNPANLFGIEAAEWAFPNIPHVAVFDTAFFSSMPDVSYLYAVPYGYYERYGVRKYGTRGIAHSYAFSRAVDRFGVSPDRMKCVICDLGNTSSVSAVKNGLCIDTAEIIGATKSGPIDPTIVPYVMKKDAAICPDEIDQILNKKSGLFGVMDGIPNASGEGRDLTKMAAEGNQRAKLALSMLSHEVIQKIGGFAAEMGGIDALIFTGSAGVHDTLLRAMVLDKLTFLGVQLDKNANGIVGEEAEISGQDSRVRVFLIPDNEALEIAKQTLAVIGTERKKL